MDRGEVLRLLVAELPVEAARRVLLALLSDGATRGDQARAADFQRTRTTSNGPKPRSTSPSLTPVKPAGRRRQDGAAPSSDAMTEWLALREQIRGTGINRADLAQAVGYAATTVSLALDRKTPPTHPLLAKLTAWLEQQTASEVTSGASPFPARPNGAAAAG